KLGYPVLSVDVTTLGSGPPFVVQPGYPRVNLWPEALSSLQSITDFFPKIAPTWNKRYLDLKQHGDRFFSEPAPLGGVYVLGNRSNSASAPRVEKLNHGDALISLLTHAHGRHLLQ